MSAFTDNISLSPHGRDWKLLTDLHWEIGHKGSGYVFTVPAGAVSDLASIPWYARWLFDRGNARYAKAALVHDEMLKDKKFSRITAAAEFASMLRADGVAKWRVVVMGLAVLFHTLKK